MTTLHSFLYVSHHTHPHVYTHTHTHMDVTEWSQEVNWEGYASSLSPTHIHMAIPHHWNYNTIITPTQPGHNTPYTMDTLLLTLWRVDHHWPTSAFHKETYKCNWHTKYMGERRLDDIIVEFWPQMTSQTDIRLRNYFSIMPIGNVYLQC